MNAVERVILPGAAEKSYYYGADRLIALLPAAVWGIWLYGARAAVIMLITPSVCCAVFAVIRRLLHKKKTEPAALTDAAVAGLVAAFSLPAAVPYYVPVVGATVAAAVMALPGKKLIDGGFFSAAMMRMLFPAMTARFTLPFSYISALTFAPTERAINSLRVYTPLQILKDGKVSSGTLWDQFYGLIAGNIGEISALLLILGLIFLILRRRVRPHAPAAMILTVALLTVFLPQGDSEAEFFMLSSLFSGGIMLFCTASASDPAITPITDLGRTVFGVGAGVITVLIRYYGSASDGVYAAAVLMSLLTPLIDRLTRPAAYGRVGLKGGRQK